MAFLLVVPLGILGGVIAALYRARAIDRIITVAGMSATIVPEFVSGIVLILIFGVWLRWFPISATWPQGAGPLTQVYYLLLPSLPLVLILFGYIARMARAGMIEALDAEYTRTAILKGLSYPKVIWRHVLRNALLPTISVIATQTVYLIGGLVVIEILFQYQGIGGLIYTAANKKDFPMLQAGVMAVGALFALATLAGRSALCPAQSAHQIWSPGMSNLQPAVPDQTALRRDGWQNDVTRLLHSPSFMIGGSVVLFWVFCALFGRNLVPYDPFADDLLNSLLPPSGEHWFGTDQLGRDVFSRVIAGARDILTVAPLATIISTILGTALGLTMGYFGGLIDEILEPHRRCRAGIAHSHRGIAGTDSAWHLDLHGFVRHRLYLCARSSHARYGPVFWPNAASTMWRRPNSAVKAASTSCSSKSCQTSFRRFWSR